MNEYDIKQDIDAITSQSPVESQIQAIKKINFPEAPMGQSTLVTRDLQENVADQIVDTEKPTRGVEFNPDTTEVYSGGIALPGAAYNTRRQITAENGNPLYFKPNYQAVAPFPETTPVGPVKSETLDYNKLAWQVATANGYALDREYIGYIPVIEPGRASWWSHFVQSGKGFVSNLPSMVKQGVYNLGGLAAKTAGGFATLAQTGYDLAANALFGDESYKEVFKDNWDNLKTYVDAVNHVVDDIDKDLSTSQRYTMAALDADLSDQTFRAKSARGLSSAAGTFGVALLSGNPELMFALLNAADMNEMRHNALNAGVAPGWAEAYSIGGTAVNTALDLIQFDTFLGVHTLTKEGTKDFLKRLAKDGLYKGSIRLGKETAKMFTVENALNLATETATEMIQEGISGAFDEDFLNTPVERLAIAGLSAAAMSLVTIPARLRHMRYEDALKTAKVLGVYSETVAARKNVVDLVNRWADNGQIDANSKDKIIDLIWSEAPETVVKTIREGVLGQIDKISDKEKAEFYKALQNMKKSKMALGEQFKKLDVNVNTALQNTGFSDAEKTMINGMVRGLAAMKMLQDGTNPSEIKVPKFVINNSQKGSSYDPKTNTITITTAWSNTDYTKGRDINAADDDYRKYIAPGFIPSTQQSDFMSSIIHEVGHWVDYQIGEKGFSDFLEHYYRNIATVFGNQRSTDVYNASKQGTKRLVKEKNYVDNKMATEWSAQSLSRLGKRSAEYFGLGGSKAAKFLSYANLMLNQLSEFSKEQGLKNTEAIDNFQTAMQESVKQNADIVNAMIDLYGSDKIKQMVKDFMNDTTNPDEDFVEYLARHDALKDLFHVLDSFADSVTLDKVKDFFDNESEIQNFVTAGDMYFRSGYDQAVADVKARRDAVKQKAAEGAGAVPKTKTASNNMRQVALSNGQVVSVPSDVPNFGGDEGLDFVKKQLGVEEKLPNDYIVNTDPVADIKQSFDSGKGNPVDEIPSYDRKVDGRTLDEDMNILSNGIMNRLKNLPNKFVKWMASSPWGWGLDRIVTTIFGREASDKLDLAGKYSKKSALLSNSYRDFMVQLKPLIGDINTDQHKAMLAYKTMNANLGFVRVSDVDIVIPNSNGMTTKKDLTGWEVLGVYLTKRMGEKYANRIQQSTKTDINELIAQLTPEEKQFGEIMSDFLRDTWIKKFGDKNAVPQYWPILDFEHEILGEVNIDNLRQRMNTNNPIAITDAGRVFSKELSRFASMDSGFYQTVKRLRDALQYGGAEGRNIKDEIDAEFKRRSVVLAAQIKSSFGDDGYNNIIRLLDTMIADPKEQMLDSAASRTLNQMGMNIIRSLLSFKFMSLPKNMTNLAMMWGGAKDQGAYWNAFAEGVGNMKRTWEYMLEHSSEIRMRYNNIGYNEFLDQRNTGGNAAPMFKGISKIFAKLNWTGDKTAGMAKMTAALDMMGDTGLKMFMLNGDAVANIYGGYGLIKDYMAQGLSEDEAFKKLDRYIVEHQSSSNLTMKPLKQLEANKSIAGQIMAFTSEGLAKWSSIFGTFDEVRMGTAEKSEAFANALSIGLSMVLYAALTAGIYDLWDDDEKVREEAVNSLSGALIDQLAGMTVLGNGIITPFLQNMAGVGGRSGISAPIWTYLTEGTTNLQKGEYDRIITKALEATGILVGANSLYNDMLGMMFVNSDEPDVREAGFRMLLGHTPKYAEKRTGVKLSEENIENEEED